VRFSRRTLRTGAQVALAVATLVAAGCGGPIDSVRLSAPTPSATASAAPTPLSLSLTNLSFSGTAQAQTVSVTDTGYSRAFATSGCSGIVTSAVSGTTVTVTAVAVGACTLMISDSAGNSAPVAVTVTTLSVPVQ
jgi:hypothetical protein